MGALWPARADRGRFGRARIEDGLPVPVYLESIFIDGTALGGWRLIPLYDVLPRASHATERFLHLGVGPQGRLATLDNALASHDRFTLSRAVACELIADIWRVVREWRVQFEGFGVAPADIEKIAPAFRRLDEVSTVALRRQLH